MKRTRIPAIAALGAVAVLLLSACGSSTSEANDDATGGKTFNVGIKFDQPGMGLKAGSEYTGFDADLAREVTKRMGGTAKFTESISSQRETLLRNGTVDMVFATYTIQDDRDKVVDFAGPYLVAGQDIMVAADNSDIHGPEDLNGKTLCAVEGSNSTQRLRDKYAQSTNLYPAQTYSECMELLSSGTVQAVSTDDVILAGFAAQDRYRGQFKIVGNNFSTEPYGVGLAQGSTLCEDVNTALTAIVADGTWARLVTENFGETYTPRADANPPSPRGCAANQ